MPSSELLQFCGAFIYIVFSIFLDAPTSPSESHLLTTNANNWFILEMCWVSRRLESNHSQAEVSILEGKRGRLIHFHVAYVNG